VKITPAHDFNDFEVGVRHHLRRINILVSKAGSHWPRTPSFSRMSRRPMTSAPPSRCTASIASRRARKIVERLEEKG